MGRDTTKKLWVLGVSFALFLGGAGALQLERGTVRIVILTVVFAGLLTIAGLQTARHLKKKK